ncbi:MAG: pilus assembly protein TadG-related protein [Novosphingobium sp.]
MNHRIFLAGKSIGALREPRDGAANLFGIARFWRRLGGDTSGNIVTLTAMMLVPLVGLSGLALDTIQWYSARNTLQRAADSAALAGANTVSQVSLANTQTAVTSAVNHDLSYYTATNYTVQTVETPPTAGANIANATAVRVVLTTSSTLPFSSMFVSAAPVIRVSAVATNTSQPPVCALATSPSAGRAFTVQGSAVINMTCGLASNSTSVSASQPAMYATGTVTATQVRAVGSVNSSGVTSGTPVVAGAAPTPNPFTAYPKDTFASRCPGGGSALTTSGKSVTTVYPGCYSGIDLKGDTLFSPGVYFLGGGDIKIGSNLTATGSGVTFVLLSSGGSAGGTIIMNGNSTVNLTAPVTGATGDAANYAGMLFVGDPTGGGGWSITGNNTSVFKGAMYNPANNITFTGSSGMTTPCVTFVADTLTFSGNSSVANVCPSSSGVVNAGGTVGARLVE